ncbi:hypothetical protein ElyMa_000148800 [Elysia marginata]|uniref:Reverse transcriptase domain-containing protein n=1 Tax=Elysia marginata TaxID=1093978 RepID=A0AAV4EQP8_9GAST|nr:hypothetical protein ElyMa_000148800 [Elysia marginata]
MKESTGSKQSGIQWNLWQHLDVLDFADDLALLSHTKGEMQSKTEDLNIDLISNNVGPRSQSGQSKVLGSGAETEDAIILGTDALEELVLFTYLRVLSTWRVEQIQTLKQELERQDQHAHNYKGFGKLETKDQDQT